MSRRSAPWRPAAVLILGLLACRPEQAAGPEQPPPPAAGEAGQEEVALYFLAPGGAEGGVLRRERRSLELPPGRDARLAAILRELLGGPRREGLQGPFPEEVRVGRVYVDEAGIAFVDLESPTPAPPSSGSRLELLRVYSVVDTVLLNDAAVRGVVLLWNGTQRPTFAGHVDTGHPLVLERRLIALEREAGAS